MPNRLTNSVTAAIPDTGVNDGSGAPTRTRRRNRLNLAYSSHPIGVLSTRMIVAW
jgi:hypothetical protein